MSEHVFTEEDLDVWPFYKSYLIELLNGEYDIKEARIDLLSLLKIKDIENNNDQAQCW